MKKTYLLSVKLKAIPIVALFLLITVLFPSPASAVQFSDTDTLPSMADPASESPSSSETEPDTPSSGTDESSEPETQIFTVTYQMGVMGSKIERVKDGDFPRLVPNIVTEHATFSGWFLANGTEVKPSEVKITGDITFYARIERSLSDLLETEQHNAYMSGYDTNMFKPNRGITRAEAATMFSNLLRIDERKTKTFSDVTKNDWFYDAVGNIAELGIVGGYKDGSFKPNQNITRAEFVKMAVSFDTLEYGAASFSDISETHWSNPYVYTATKKGWISGFTDGTFKPDTHITRAEAATIVNRMLGRTPPEHIPADVRNFYDVYSDNWAYGQIVEATNAHVFAEPITGKHESWESYEKQAAPKTAIWIYDDGARYYVSAETGKFVSGDVTIDETAYYFDPSTKRLYTGFRYIDEWCRYYLNGVIVNDISELGVVEAPYFIRVYKPANYAIVFAQDGDNGYTIPVKAMIASCGNNTPTGGYYSPAKYRWLRMVGGSWAQWCTQIKGDYLFHSVPNALRTNSSLYVNAYNNLGTTQSLGCIRLTCKDAKWVYDNCRVGTSIFISATDTSGPLLKPGSIKLPAWHTWDPTDPTAVWRCDEKGCH